MHRAWPPILALGLVLTACQPSTQYVQYAGTALGTFYHITLERPDLCPEPDALPQAIDSVFTAVNHRFSIYDSTSLISRFNRRVPGFVVDPEFSALTRLAQELFECTGGAFDPSVAPVASLWGFGNQPVRAVDSLEVAQVLGHCGMARIHTRGDTVRKDDSCSQLTYNALAKGYAVDRLADLLARRGVRNFLIEVGGEVRALGHSPRGQAWVIGIDSPEPELLPGQRVVDRVSIRSGALATSGNYRSFVLRDGQHVGHTIDPRTGFPVQRDLLSATVFAPTCAVADALATALMVLGSDSSQRLIREMPGIEGVLITLQPDSTFKVWHSSGFAKGFPLGEDPLD